MLKCNNFSILLLSNKCSLRENDTFQNIKSQTSEVYLKDTHPLNKHTNKN